MINVGVIGCGYWGPNLIRNFVVCPDTELLWACDKDEKQLEKVTGPYPGVDRTVDFGDILADERVDAIAVATPVHTHFPIAKACLENGKHVLVEKPLTSNVEEGEELVRFARKKGLQLMSDHTFCYAGAVRKMKEIVDSGILGELFYFDSVRVNLGLFQRDINVIWDLAPHDLSILDFILDDKPVSVSAHGVCHAENNLENVAYVSLRYSNAFISHFHLNWLSPVKIRKTIIGGSEKMLVWNDLDPAEKIKIYDKGIVVRQGAQEERNRLLVSYRSGDMHAPQLDHTEALSLVVREFASCIEEGRPALTDGEAGLRVLRVLEAAERSVKADGANVRIQYSTGA
jgi:predicted dehydrogenase